MSMKTNWNELVKKSHSDDSTGDDVKIKVSSNEKSRYINYDSSYYTNYTWEYDNFEHILNIHSIIEKCIHSKFDINIDTNTYDFLDLIVDFIREVSSGKTGNQGIKTLDIEDMFNGYLKNKPYR